MVQNINRRETDRLERIDGTKHARIINEMTEHNLTDDETLFVHIIMLVQN